MQGCVGLERAYAHSETAYVSSSIQLANAYALRTGPDSVACVVTECFCSGIGTDGRRIPNSVVTPAVVIYFAVTLSSGIQSTVETLQQVGVVSLTAERVRMLEEVPGPTVSYPPACGLLTWLCLRVFLTLGVLWLP